MFPDIFNKLCRRTPADHLIGIVLLFFFGVSPLISAPPAYAPLLNNQTTAVICINREKLDLPSLLQKGVKAAAQITDSMISDPNTAKQVKMGLPLMIAGYAAGLTSLLDSMEEASLDEFYFIATPNIRESPGYFALPLSGNETDEQIQDLQKGLTGLRSFNIPVMQGFRRSGFIFAPVIKPQLSEDKVKEFVVKEFKELHSSPRSEFEKAFKEFPEAGITFIYTGNSETKKQFSEAMGYLENSVSGADNAEAAGLAETMNQTISHLAEQSSYMVAVLDQTDSSVKIRVRLKKGTKEAAASFQNISKAVFDSAESKDRQLTEDQKKLLGELTDLLLPEVGKNSLDWRFDGQFINKHKPLIERYIRMTKKVQEKETLPGGNTNRPNKDEVQ